MKIGLIINPIAGMGGSVGLKGTDGVLNQALAMGATPHAEANAQKALMPLLNQHTAGLPFELLCAPGRMGADLVKALEIPATVLEGMSEKRDLADFSEADTMAACESFVQAGVSLIVFGGGDGTARNVLAATKGVVPVIGIPTGVKMHSGVFALRPALAGALLQGWIEGRITRTIPMEVLDLDEEAYRQGNVGTALYGYLNVPYDARLLQGKKSASPLSDMANQQAIASHFVDHMQPDTLYFIGPGSTTNQILKTLNLNGTLIGFDALLNGSCLATDLNEAGMLAILDSHPDKKAVLVVTPIGGQGVLFGRGNQQASFRVLQRIGKAGIQVVATQMKLAAFKGRPFTVDTGHDTTDQMLTGYYKVLVGYNEHTMYRVEM